MAVRKWEKYRLLFKYNLSNEDDMREQIKRYQKSEVDRLFNDIEQDFLCPASSNIHIIKLVPQEIRAKIQNYVIHDLFELREIRARGFSCRYTFEEFWVCKSKYTSAAKSVFGRFYINSGSSTDVSQYIEQVWADTARKIESIGKDIPYISAIRPWWGWQFNIQKKDFGDMNSTEASRYFWSVITQLEQRREYIEQFSDDLASLGIHTFDIEYKIVNGAIKVIDWDSPSDDFVIGGLL